MPPLLNPDIDSDTLPSKQPEVSAPAVSPILILSPSSLSHRPQILESLLSSLPSSQPHDLHMLDRIAVNLAVLPSNHYNEAILALPPNEETTNEIDSAYLELKTVFTNILETMRPGGQIRIGQPKQAFTKDALLAGFLIETRDSQTILVKPQITAAMPLRLKRSRPQNSNPLKRLNLLSLDPADAIDDSTLIQPQDFTKPIFQPNECAPPPGKRRKACKDCTCGLKELEETENAKSRELPVVKLGDEELDFTVQGKMGSCGNCSLGDAFRCSGCPFIGMPAFKPGEEVKLLREAARWADDI